MSFDQNLLLICLVISSMAGIALRKYLVGFFLRLFPYFLLFSCAVQIFAREYSRPLPHKSNHWIYNIYSPIECIFYSLMLVEAIRSRRLKKSALTLIGAYAVFAFYNIFFYQGLEVFNTYSYIFEAITVVCVSLFVFIEIARQESGDSLFKNPIFWIGSALLINFLGDFVIMGLLDRLVEEHNDYASLTFTIIKYLNIIKCVLFTVAFFCRSNWLNRYDPVFKY